MQNAGLEQLIVDLAEQARSRFYGKYRGIVRDNQDPETLGRLRAEVQVLPGLVLPWALPCAAYAGPNQGLYAIPPVDAAVWIEFEAGDTNLPIWSGSWWGKDQVPANEERAGATPQRKILRSASGLVVALDDDDKKISISDGDASNLITIEVQGATIRIQATTKVVVEAAQIDLVADARHPLVFGDDLLNYLNQIVNIYQTHTHPGEMALGVFPVTPMTPLPPMPPATAALLSRKVKTG